MTVKSDLMPIITISKNERMKPHAIILGLSVTGLATARALAECGVSVHGVSLSIDEPGRASWKFHVIDLHHLANNQMSLVSWLFDYANALGNFPVVIPTSDFTALMLAQHKKHLQEVCRFWSNSFEQLSILVSKDKLYQLAPGFGIKIPPAIISPRNDEIEHWCSENPGPYLAKPFYQAEGDSLFLKEKNRQFENAKELMDFVKAYHGHNHPFIAQRLLRGGDGSVFDCYGLCDQFGRIRTMATHRRIRQYPPDFGFTCYGEIPGVPRDCGEEGLFDSTRTLFRHFHYHGIFGVEWLQDRETGELFLIDVNARPFYTIGHLKDCGLNLPLLAYRDLCGDDLPNLLLTPRVQKFFWIDFWRDAGTFFRLYKTGKLGWGDWILSLLRCRSYALWNIRDPRPGCWKAIKMVHISLKRFFR